MVGAWGQAASKAGRLSLYAEQDSTGRIGALATLPPEVERSGITRMILVGNENGGVTAMLPEDD